MGLFGQGTSLRRRTPVTTLLVAGVTAMFLITIAQGGFTPEVLYDLGALRGDWVLDDGDWWRTVTVMFLHGSFLHFFFNTIFGLYVLSGALERIIGSLRFAILYFVTGLLASAAIVLTDIVTLMTEEQVAMTVGASGAIFGVLGALLYLTSHKPEWFTRADVSAIRALTLINVIQTFLAPNISIPGHIGGLVAGYLLAAVMGLHTIPFGGRKSEFEDPYQRSYIDPGKIDDKDAFEDFESDGYDPFASYDKDVYRDKERRGDDDDDWLA